MQEAEVIRRAREIVAEAGIPDTDLGMATALDFFNTTRDVIKEWPRERLENTEWLVDFSESLRRLRDEFDQVVAADPCCVYRPAHYVAEEFHKSLAKIRYYYGGNRISKTQAAYVDNYWVVTGQHPYRPRPPLPTSVAVIGTSFTKYAPNVFEAKLITGEPGNPLSPLFPEGGKFFSHYDERKKRLLLACPLCVEKKRPKECKHVRSSITLFSDREGPLVMAGMQVAQMHLDEQIQREFYSEGMERTKTVPHSGMIVTETPLYGKAWWTYQELYTTGKNKEINYSLGPTPIVSLHSISQYDAGLVAKEQIDLTAATYTEPERRARIFGEHVAASEQAVFDLVELSKMREHVAEPSRGYLIHERELAGEKAEDVLVEEVKPSDILFQQDGRGDLRVWEAPSPFHQYVIGVDVAKGLTKRDASCATVYKIRAEGSFFTYQMVAQYHGWINPDPYAEVLFKLGLWYGEAPLVIERNGPGDTVIYRLANHLHCWFLLRDVQNPAMVRQGMTTLYGVDTNVATKGMMIANLQQAIHDSHSHRCSMIIPCEDTIAEFENYIQEVSESGQTYKFKGIGNAHDDRVMAAAVAVYATKTFPEAFSIDKQRELDLQRYRSSFVTDNDTKSFWEGVRKDLHDDRNRGPFD